MSLTRTMLSGLATAALATAPVMAQASRAAAPADETSDLGGEGAWIAIVGVIAVVVLAVIAATNDDEESVSP